MIENANTRTVVTVSALKGDRLVFLAQSITLVLAFVLVGYIAWTLDRGLELTDESFYVLTAMYPRGLRFFFTPTHWVAAPLWTLTHGLAAFRAAGWIILTGSAVVLALGTSRAAALLGLSINRRKTLVWIIATTAICAWLYSAILNFSPSYNLLGAAGAYGAVGLFFLALDTADKRLSMVSAGVVGILLGIATLSKFSAGVAVLCLLIALHAAFFRQRGVRLLNVALMLGAALATVAFAVSIESTWHDAYRSFLTGLSFTKVAQQNETVSARLIRNWSEGSDLMRVVCITFGGPLLVAAVAALRRSAVAGVAAVGWFVWILVHGHFWIGGMDVYQVQSRPLVAAMCMMLVLTLRSWITRPQRLILVSALLVLPIAIAIGTGNPIPFQLVLVFAPWGALCGVLASMDSDEGWRVAPALMCLVFTGLATSQIISSGWRAPYRLAQPIQAQNIPIKLGALGTVKVDHETLRFVDDLKAASRHCGLPPKMPFLGFYRLPGVALILDEIPVDTPELFAEPFASAVLSGADKETVRKAAIALDVDSTGDAATLPSTLKATFPNGYRLCGGATLPYNGTRVEVWAPELQTRNQ